AVLFFLRRHPTRPLLLGQGRLAKAVIGVIPEETPLELVRARLGHGSDRSAADLVVFGLVVGRDDLVLADRQLRERAAAGRVLAADTTLEHVVLLAHAVDEDVDAVRILRAA